MISWSTCPREVTNAAHADLDLFILDHRGYPVAAGLSWDGSYEITEITAPAGMTYSIVVARYGDRWLDCDGFEIFDQYGQVVDHFVRLGVAFDVR